MARFKPGQSGNPTGRKKGAKNRTTEALRTAVQTFIENNFDSIQGNFDNLKPAEKLNFIASLLKLVLPPPVSIETLSETQLQQLEEYFLKKYVHGKRQNN
jgi:hypothetical protein